MDRNRLKFLLLTASAFALAESAHAQEAAQPSSGQSARIGEVVITAEKREQSLQEVPVAVSAYTAEKREVIGINSIQDMTNFTPGLVYNSSTDRISLRGVGRLTNVLSGDASVANYNDGVYETFAVQAGRSTLFLDRVEILRGPQGTLYGRNSIGGAINEISKRPTKDFQGEVRASYANFDHYTLEGAVSGPISDNVQFRLAGDWDRQTQGWIDNIVPGMPDEGNVINEWFAEGQLQVKFNERLDTWLKVGGGVWHNGAGGPGSQSGGWYPSPWATYEVGASATELSAGYGCNANTTNVVNLSPTGCVNPAINSPWTVARAVPYRVRLPLYTTIANHWTFHADGFDVKYVTGGVNYHYLLTGPTGTEPNTLIPPITSYTLPGGLVIHPAESFNYQEHNNFWSNELNLVSTNEGALQWVLGAYLFQQHYTQPVFTTNPDQPQWNVVFQGTCAQTGGVCAPNPLFRRFDNRPDMHATSYAFYGQTDWKMTDQLKTTLGLRYSHDRKNGTESVRLLCFAVPACFAAPEFSAFIPGGIPAVDLTQLPTVVDAGKISHGGTLPKGVVGDTTYNPATGFATRAYDATWEAVTGTAGLEWQPDTDTLLYGKYSRGYKSGGFNIGIFTVLSFNPWTDKETVDSYEIGLKKDFGPKLRTNTAVYYYNYKNLQIPITTAGNGGLAPTSTAFYNVPKAVSEGAEFEVTFQPIDDFQILFNYSYNKTEIKEGSAVDIVDPTGVQPGAKPLLTIAQCQATPGLCATDAVGTPGANFQIPQNLSGNRLPNAPENKVAVNANYTWHVWNGSTLIGSVSYIWRDKQFGTVFSRAYTTAPSWDQVDARLTWTSENERTRLILFGKNLFDDIGYDAGAVGYHLAGLIDPPAGAPAAIVNQGIASGYSVTPPRTYGIEIQYKF
jgi:iron complex outermembrane receptor protein